MKPSCQNGFDETSAVVYTNNYLAVAQRNDSMTSSFAAELLGWIRHHHPKFHSVCQALDKKKNRPSYFQDTCGYIFSMAQLLGRRCKGKKDTGHS